MLALKELNLIYRWYVMLDWNKRHLFVTHENFTMLNCSVCEGKIKSCMALKFLILKEIFHGVKCSRKAMFGTGCSFISL